jgi:hypothetical protein
VNGNVHGGAQPLNWNFMFFITVTVNLFQQTTKKKQRILKENIFSSKAEIGLFLVWKVNDRASESGLLTCTVRTMA